MDSPKILLFDLETAPNLAYIWRLYSEVTSMKMVKDNWYVLCWSAKWLGSKEIMSEGLYSNSKDDSKIMKKLWKLFDEADIVMAHNAVKFDCKKSNARFIANGMLPPSPYKVIDTLKVARKHFSFMSNRLGDLGQFLKLGNKLETGGFELWEKCMAGDLKAWNKMVRYCNQDVKLLEKVYLKLRPYMNNHPNAGMYLDRAVCPTCGSNSIQYHGVGFTNAYKYKRFQCNKCGSWGRDTNNLLENKTKRSL